MTNTQNVQALLERGGWIQALARTLVADPDVAADLAQETWVDALERRPDASRPLGAWLGVVMRNNLRKLRRGEGHRRAREERAARGEGSASTLDVVERAATHRDVVLAVLALEEPYRSTILMRFFDQLSYQEIAERTGITRAAVNSRITRGLERLRDRLASLYQDDRRALGLALLPLAKLGPGAAKTFLGVTLMHATIGIGTVLFVSASLWVGLREPAARSAPALATSELVAPASTPFEPALAAPERVAAPVLLAQDDERRERVHEVDEARLFRTELFHQEALGAEIESLAVNTSSGDVTVVPSTSGRLEVTAKVVANRDKVEAARLTEVFEDHVSIESEDGELTIEDAHRNERGWTISLIVAVPRALSVAANSGSGDVEVGYGAGTVRANTGSGDVRVALEERSVSKVLANSGSGDVEVLAHSIDGDLAANSGSGDISVTVRNGASAGSLALNTGSGDVSLTLPPSAIGAFDLETSSGTISVPDALGLQTEKKNGVNRAWGELGGAARYRLRSGSGDLSLRLE